MYNNLEVKVQKVYEEECARHLTCVSNTIFENELDEGITIIGLADAFSSIIAKQADLDDIREDDEEVSNKILAIIDSKEDKLRTFALINKLCTEMLCKALIAKEIVKENI